MKTTLAVLLVFAAATAVQAQSADAIYHGGPILTMNDAALRAEAVAVKEGRILAVGSKQDVLKTASADTALVDLGGKALLPGFVDAHGHVLAGGIQSLSANILPPPDGDVQDIPSLQRVVREWAVANDAAVKQIGFIIGFGYDNSQLKEQRHPTRADLDAVSTDLPVLLVHQSGHIVAVNS